MGSETCTYCGFDTSSVSTTNAAMLIRQKVNALTNLLDGFTNDRPPAPIRARAWNAAEYAGHIRDVLIIQRERILRARFEIEPAAAPMMQDDRVMAGEYHDWSLRDLAFEIQSAGNWLARTIERLDAAAWHRRMIYNYPCVASRSLLWVTAHTAHEIEHHTQDIRDLLRPVTSERHDL